jgi:bacterioferritin-associated ferredoxin
MNCSCGKQVAFAATGLAAMYVCLCNAITDSQVRAAAAGGATRPKDVFASCGCGAQCANCTRVILSILRDGVAGEVRVAG